MVVSRAFLFLPLSIAIAFTLSVLYAYGEDTAAPAIKTETPATAPPSPPVATENPAPSAQNSPMPASEIPLTPVYNPWGSIPVHRDPPSKIKPKPAPKKTPKPQATSKGTTKLPLILQEIQAKYVQAVTLTAEFKQVNEVIALGTKKNSSGIIMIKRPNKLRWETHQPDRNILVSDGRKFWFYTPPFDESEHGQLIERRSSEIQSRLANALLSGSFSAVADMKIKQGKGSTFELTPKKGSAGTVIKAHVEIDIDLKLIKKVILEHQGGNRSEISLSKIVLAQPMGDELFIFTPPPNTDVVTQ